MRFIEYMDVGNANNWTSEKLVPKKEIIAKIDSRYPLKEIGRAQGSAPSVDYEFVDGGGDIGVIDSVTEPFCSSCTRARITADGKIVTCLFSEVGHDVKAMLRSGASDEEILELLSSIWMKRADRYSQERLEALRDSSYDPRATENRNDLSADSQIFAEARAVLEHECARRLPGGSINPPPLLPCSCMIQVSAESSPLSNIRRVANRHAMPVRLQLLRTAVVRRDKGPCDRCHRATSRKHFLQ